MAEVTSTRAQLNDPAGGAVTIAVTYDDVSLTVVSVLARNTSSRRATGAWWLPGGRNEPRTILPGENSEERVPAARRQSIERYSLHITWGAV